MTTWAYLYHRAETRRHRRRSLTAPVPPTAAQQHRPETFGRRLGTDHARGFALLMQPHQRHTMPAAACPPRAHVPHRCPTPTEGRKRLPSPDPTATRLASGMPGT